VQGLSAWLRDKTALIVLDSCEHVVGAAATLAEALLKAAPGVSILTTSREPLRAEGETLHRLAALELPANSVDLTVDDAHRYSAIQLFVERAMATVDDFGLADADVSAVLEICRRLDGIPLALELAAARVGVFGLRDLAAHLDDRFRLLTSGRRTALPRQQTLRATIDWSYDLLPKVEKVVLRRLAVFRGNFTVEAASSVVADEHIHSFDVIGRGWIKRRARQTTRCPCTTHGRPWRRRPPLLFCQSRLGRRWSGNGAERAVLPVRR
jgi:predicted ATPase